MKIINALRGLVFLTMLVGCMVYPALAQAATATGSAAATTPPPNTGTPSDTCNCLIPFLLMIPGLLGLLFASIKDYWDNVERKRQNLKEEDIPKNHFSFAFLNSLTWIFTLVLLALLGIKELHFFDQKLKFGFSVPILGFLGAMLFVLDMFRKGRKDIQRGKEFAIRIIM